MVKFPPIVKSILYFAALLLGAVFSLYLTPPFQAKAAVSHIVISEVQVAGSAANDDFIELYNPTSSPINLNGYQLVKRTSSGGSDVSIKVLPATQSIPAYGFYLWCNTNLSSLLNCDATTGSYIADNNSVALKNGTEIIDAVTFGNVDFPLGEGISVLAPGKDNSVERKANNLSTSLSMAVGGTDEFLGNGQDTDNNSQDFVLRNVSGPQNSHSNLEQVEQELTPTPTPAPTDTPIPTPTVIPTAAPTDTPIPTQIPTLIPTVTPTPTEPLQSLPTPTVTVVPITPVQTFVRIPTFRLLCVNKIKTLHILNLLFHVSYPVCRLMLL